MEIINYTYIGGADVPPYLVGVVVKNMQNLLQSGTTLRYTIISLCTYLH